jgi:hypothetical protein
MRNRVAGFERNVFGGVIFTRADRSDIKTLKDLPSHSFAAVDLTSLGGFQMTWGTLAKQGIDPYADFRPLRFTEIHDAVVMAVLRGEVDSGSVRTDILERMAADGIIQMSDIRVLNPQSDPEFPFVRSTPLYPEWPFSKLRKMPNALAQQVAIALLQMPADDRAARAGDYADWTVLLDYQLVHRLLETLPLPPYNHAGRFTLRDAVRRYWVGLLLGVLALVVMASLTARVLRLNRRLARATTAGVLQRRRGPHRRPGRARRRGHPPNPPVRVRKEEPEVCAARLSAMFETVLGLVQPEAQRAWVTITLG